MSLIGVLGGMGPAATVDFMSKLVALTPATCDQEHLQCLVANLPHVPDRSSHLLGKGPDPLPYLLRNVDLLNRAGVALIVVPCNTSHHWYDAMQAHSPAPLLHIAQACVQALAVNDSRPVAIFGTRGAVQSGFYQRVLQQRGVAFMTPDSEGTQHKVDACIRQIKQGDVPAGAAALAEAVADCTAQGVRAIIMGCTEIPIAASHLGATQLPLIDSTLELARQTVDYAVSRGWNRANIA